MTTKDLRPISLCNVVYKIATKVVANRLKLVLPHIISDNQSGFVTGRLITDNVIVASEVVHFLKGKRKGADGVAALKLDIAKAYDKLGWEYLEGVLIAMGFCRR